MEQNITIMLNLGGYVGVEKYGYVYFIFLFSLYVFILCCNGIIIFVIWTHKNLHEPMYIFIAVLSLNSILFTCVIYPKLFVDVLSNEQTISYERCLVQAFFFYTLTNSDLILLLVMAFDRYLSICRPLQYSSTMNTTNVSIILSLAWFVPAFQMAVTMILQSKQGICNSTLEGFYCNVKMVKIHCRAPMYLTAWSLFNLITSSILPLLLVLITYIKIFVTIYQSHGEVRKKAIETCSPHLIVLFTLLSLISFDFTIGHLDSILPKSINLIMSLQMLVYSPLFNPIIYGWKMKEIWKHIKGLFLCCKDVEMNKSQYV
ncbi:olfactory receptor 11A1-like [Stigmatopora nigra]